MDYKNHNTGSRKNKHLNIKNRMIVEIRHGTTNQCKEFKVDFTDTR